MTPLSISQRIIYIKGIKKKFEGDKIITLPS